MDLIERDYGTDTYSRQTGVTLRTKLCAQLGLERKEGIVTANAYTSLNGSTGMAEGRLAVDGEDYRFGREDMNGLLGYRVAYYAKTNEGGAKALYSGPAGCESEQNGQLPAGGHCRNDADAFSVYQEDGAKTQTYRLDLPVKTVCNGKYMLDAGRDDWQIQNGRIRLLDNDGDGRYELVFVEEVQTYLASGIDAEKGIIHLKTFSAQTPGQFARKDLYRLPERGHGFPASAGRTVRSLRSPIWPPMQMIGILQSKDQELVTIISGSAPFEGTVDAVHAAEDKAVIDGESYELAKNSQGDPLLELRPATRENSGLM